MVMTGDTGLVGVQRLGSRSVMLGVMEVLGCKEWGCRGWRQRGVRGVLRCGVGFRGGDGGVQELLGCGVGVPGVAMAGSRVCRGAGPGPGGLRRVAVRAG